MNLLFATRAWDDYTYWQETDKRVVKKINDLLKDICRSPYQGIGKPEPLKHIWAGYWSRRITDEHRLIYKVEGSMIRIAQARYHYER